MTDRTDEKWFSVRTWDTIPVPVEGQVTKVTEHCVWINGRRAARSTSWLMYFPSADEAWNWLEDRARTEWEAAKRETDRARSKMDLIAQNRRKVPA